MKKIVLSIVLLSGLMATSQITVNPGVRAGVNLANITNVENSKSLTDFYVGGFAEIDFSRFYKMQPEINYTRQGASLDEGVNIEIQYLSLNIANKFYVVKDAGFHLIAGPSIAVKVGDNGEGGLSDLLEEFDFVFFGGAGFDFDFGLAIEARYNIGLVDLFGSNVGESVDVSELYLNKFFQIGATYKFDLGR